MKALNWLGVAAIATNVAAIAMFATGNSGCGVVLLCLAAAEYLTAR